MSLPEHVSPQDELIQKIADAIVEESVSALVGNDDTWVTGFASEFAKAAYDTVKEYMK